MVKLNFGKDRILFRKDRSCLQEYVIKSQTVELFSEFNDEKFVIDDFGFYRNKVRKGEENQVIIISTQGILKRITENGSSRKFEIDAGRLV